MAARVTTVLVMTLLVTTLLVLAPRAMSPRAKTAPAKAQGQLRSRALVPGGGRPAGHVVAGGRG